MATKQPPKARSRVQARASEPSTWAGVGAILASLSAGLQGYTATGSKTAGIAAALAAAAAVFLPERRHADDEQP